MLLMAAFAAAVLTSITHDANTFPICPFTCTGPYVVWFAVVQRQCNRTDAFFEGGVGRASMFIYYWVWPDLRFLSL